MKEFEAQLRQDAPDPGVFARELDQEEVDFLWRSMHGTERWSVQRLLGHPMIERIRAVRTQLLDPGQLPGLLHAFAQRWPRVPYYAAYSQQLQREHHGDNDEDDDLQQQDRPGGDGGASLLRPRRRRSAIGL